MQNYKKALELLANLINLGMEYPEAHTRVCIKYNVDGDQLSELYDKMY